MHQHQQPITGQKIRKNLALFLASHNLVHRVNNRFKPLQLLDPIHYRRLTHIRMSRPLATTMTTHPRATSAPREQHPRSQAQPAALRPITHRTANQTRPKDVEALGSTAISIRQQPTTMGQWPSQGPKPITKFGTRYACDSKTPCSPWLRIQCYQPQSQCHQSQVIQQVAGKSA